MSNNNGNLTSITPPGRSAHVFNYTAVSLEAGYTPPSLDAGIITSRDQQQLLSDINQ